MERDVTSECLDAGAKRQGQAGPGQVPTASVSSRVPTLSSYFEFQKQVQCTPGSPLLPSSKANCSQTHHPSPVVSTPPGQSFHISARGIPNFLVPQYPLPNIVNLASLAIPYVCLSHLAGTLRNSNMDACNGFTDDSTSSLSLCYLPSTGSKSEMLDTETLHFLMKTL